MSASYPNEKKDDPSSSAASGKSDSIHHIDTVGRNEYAKITNPLEGVPKAKLLADAAKFANAHGLQHLTAEIQKGALVAQDPENFENIEELTEEDRVALRREKTHRWDQPWQLYYLVILCSLAAAVQGVSTCACVSFVASAHLDLRISDGRVCYQRRQPLLRAPIRH